MLKLRAAESFARKPSRKLSVQPNVYRGNRPGGFFGIRAVVGRGDGRRRRVGRFGRWLERSITIRAAWWRSWRSGSGERRASVSGASSPQSRLRTSSNTAASWVVITRRAAIASRGRQAPKSGGRTRGAGGGATDWSGGNLDCALHSDHGLHRFHGYERRRAKRLRQRCNWGRLRIRKGMILRGRPQNPRFHLCGRG